MGSQRADHPPHRAAQLIEENGGPKDLDLRGAYLIGGAPKEFPFYNPIDLRPEALAPLAEAYRQTNGGSAPPWYFLGKMNLTGAQLQGVHLGGARLQEADLTGAQLPGADLAVAQLQGAVLEDAELEGAKLQNTQLAGAKLCRANLRAAYLPGAQLQGADLRIAQLQESYLLAADLRGADLRCAELQNVDLYQVNSLDGATWDGALLNHTRIRRDTLGSTIGDEFRADEEKTSDQYHRAKEAYLLLKNNFNQIGRYDDASWAYVKEQQMEKMAYYWEARKHGWQIWRAWSPFQRWLRNWAYELTTGYGERPWNAVGLGAFIIGAFSVGFWATRAIGNFWDAVVYSLATFATFNLGRTGLNPEGRSVEIASSVEALLGIGVLALVVFTLGNRMRRG